MISTIAGPDMLEVASIHGDMPQKERDAIMQQPLP